MPIALRKRAARKRKPRDPRAVPFAVLIDVPRGQKRALQTAIRAIGGWSMSWACGEHRRKPRKTWKNTRRFADAIADAHGVDFGGMDPGCFKDAFCEPLELRGRNCPDTRAKGGVGKAVRIGLGSKTRRLADLRRRPEYRILQQALTECEDLTLYPEELRAVELDEDEIEQCRQEFEDHRDRLVDLAHVGKLKKRKKAVPF